MLFKQGDIGTKFYIILKGSVGVSIRIPNKNYKKPNTSTANSQSNPDLNAQTQTNANNKNAIANNKVLLDKNK